MSKFVAAVRAAKAQFALILALVFAATPLFLAGCGGSNSGGVTPPISTASPSPKPSGSASPPPKSTPTPSPSPSPSPSPKPSGSASPSPSPSPSSPFYEALPLPFDIGADSLLDPGAPVLAASSLRSAQSVSRSAAMALFLKNFQDSRHGQAGGSGGQVSPLGAVRQALSPTPLATAGPGDHESIGVQFNVGGVTDSSKYPLGCYGTETVYLGSQKPFPYPAGVTETETKYVTMRCVGSVLEVGIGQLTDSTGTHTYFYVYHFTTGSGEFPVFQEVDEAFMKKYARRNGVNGLPSITFMVKSAGPRNSNTPETVFLADYSQRSWYTVYTTPVPHPYPPGSIFLTDDERGWGVIELWLGAGTCPIGAPEAVGNLLLQYQSWSKPQASLPGNVSETFDPGWTNEPCLNENPGGSPSMVLIGRDYDYVAVHSPNVVSPTVPFSRF